MTPTDFNGTNAVALAASRNELNYPVYYDEERKFYMSAWQPSPDDLRALNEGSPVWVLLKSPAMPEMHLFTKSYIKNDNSTSEKPIDQSSFQEKRG